MLNYQIASLDEVAEPIREHYKETIVDGKTVFLLDTKGLVPKAKLDEFRSNNIALQKRIEGYSERFDGIELSKEELEDLIAKREQYQNFQAKGKDQVEELVKQRVGAFQAEHERQVKTLREENEGMTKRLSEITIDQAAVAVGTKRGLKPTAIPDLTARARMVFRLKDGVPVAYEADGKTVRYGKDASPLTLDEWVESLAADAPHLFAESNGSGASGSSSGDSGTTGVKGNPWKRETFNLTQQMVISRKDPKLAERLKKQANAA